MVIFHRDDYHVLRLSEDTVTNSPLLVPLGCPPSDDGRHWLPGVLNQTAAAATQYDWSLNVVTYSWDVGMTKCTFRIKKAPLPRVTKFVYCYQTVGVDMIRGRIVFNTPEQSFTIFETA